MTGRLTFVPPSGGRNVEHIVSQQLTYVGRDKDCAIRLEDETVDPKQFVISFRDEQAKIQNLSNKLPIKVNQKQIGVRQDYQLKDQDTISFGNKQFLWTMSSGRRNTPRHDCLKRTRVSEPVRKVAVVTPNRRDTPLADDWVSMPPEKRRRTAYDPSAATPDESCFTRRTKYDQRMKQKLTPNRWKQSVGRTTPATNSTKKKNVSFGEPVPSPQLTYDHSTAFNRSITPGRFYRRNVTPYAFQGFNPVPEEPASPGLLGCDSFLSLDESHMSRRSGRVSTPFNKSLRGQSNKTPQSGRSRSLFPSVVEDIGQQTPHDATPSSYFASTSGSPRMMRADSPILPGGSGSPLQGRRSLAHTSRSSYGTPQDQSLRNDSLYVNAASSTSSTILNFDGTSLNQSRYDWTNEGIPSPRSDSFHSTPLQLRTPRNSRSQVESPGSAAFSPSSSRTNASGYGSFTPTPSKQNSSGYVLLSPRGKSIIDQAFNRNDLSLQLNSPSRRLFNFSPRNDNRRDLRTPQPLSVQVLTKSLKKKLDRSAMSVGSTPLGKTSGSSRRGKRPENSNDVATASPDLNGTPKSMRSSGQPNESALLSPDKADGKATPQPRVSKRSLGSTRRQSSEPNLSALSRKSSDLLQNISTPSEVRSEPKRSRKSTPKSEASILVNSPATVTPSTTSSKISKKTPGSSGKTPQNSFIAKTPKSESVLFGSPISTATKMSAPNEVRSEPKRSSKSTKSEASIHGNSPITMTPTTIASSHKMSKKTPGSSGKTPQNSSIVQTPKSESVLTGSPTSSVSKRASLRQSSGPNLSSRKSRGTPVVSTSKTSVKLEEKTTTRGTPKSTPVASTSKSSVKAEEKTTPQARLSKRSLSAPQKSVEPDLSRLPRKLSELRQKDTPEEVHSEPKSRRSIGAKLVLRQSSEPDLSASRKPGNGTPESRRLSTRKSSVKVEEKVTPQPRLSKRSLIMQQSSDPVTSRLSRRSSDIKPESPIEVPKSDRRRRSGTLSNNGPDVPSPTDVTPPSTIVDVNMRSSRKASTQAKGTPSTPLTATPRSPARNTSARRSVVIEMSAAAEKESPRGSPLSGRRNQTDVPSSSKTAVPEITVTAAPRGSEGLDVRRSSFATRRSRASFVGDAVQLLHLSTPPGSSIKTPLKTQETYSSVAASSTGTRVSSGKSARRSRASFVGDAVQLLHLSTPPSSSKTPLKTEETYSSVPTKSSGTRLSSGESPSGRGSRKSLKSQSPKVVSVHQGIRRTSLQNRHSRNSNNSEIPQISSARASRKRSSGGRVTGDEIPSTSQTPPKRTSRSSKEVVLVTPPRSLEPDIVMRSSRKTPLPSQSGSVPSTPTSALRRNARRSSRKTSVHSITKKLGIGSPRKSSPIKKLSLDPDKPDKKKMAALIACHVKKSPIKENRASTSSSAEASAAGKSTPEFLTPLKDLDAQPEERSPEDALLDALDLSRKSTVVAQPKRPSRRLRSSTNHLSAKAKNQGSSESFPSPKSEKKLLFKTPLVEFEGSHPRVESSPPRSLKSILIPSPTTASQEPMSSVFTTSPIVDFTDASGRKKIFRASPNSSSKAGGIRELVPADDSDLNIWTLFEDSSSPKTSAKKRRGSETTGANPPKTAKTPSRGRPKHVAETSASRSKVSRTDEKSPAKPASAKRTRQNLQEESLSSPNNAVSPKRLRSVRTKAKPVLKTAVDKVVARPKASGSKARSSPIKVEPPVKTQTKAAPKSSKNNPPRAGKAGTSKPSVSKAKPKKDTKHQSKPAPAKTKRGAVAKTPTNIDAGKTQSKNVKGKAGPAKSKRGTGSASKDEVPRAQPKVAARKATSSPVQSPRKTRTKSVAKSPKKVSKKAPPKAGKVSAKSPSKPTTSKSKPVKVTTKSAKAASIKTPSPSPKKLRGRSAKPKAAPKPTQPKNSNQGTKPRLSAAPKTLKGRAVGGRVAKKPTPPTSPTKTRSQRAPAASTAKSSRGRKR